jgi:uncharacterized protein YqeY
MTIAAELQGELKDAMKAGDKARLDTIRMVNSEILLAKSAPGFSGEIDDDLYLRVIAAQVKKDRKSIEEYSALGERGEAMVAKYESEVEYLSRWLPSQMGQAETEALVRATIEELGVAGDPKASGRVIGHIMKNHKDEVDGGLVNQTVRQVLDA